jgi:hypothetical protein
MRAAASRISICVKAGDRRLRAASAAIATGAPSTQNAPKRETNRMTRSIGCSVTSVVNVTPDRAPSL